MFKKSLLSIVMIAASAFAQAETHTFEVTLDSNWNSKDHLSAPRNAHFSPVVAVTHNSSFDLFNLGSQTSKAIEPLAELGRTAAALETIELANQDGQIIDSVETENMFIRNQKSQSFQVVASEKSPFLSLISMIAPSPDWVVSVSNLKLVSSQGTPIQSLVRIPLYAIDAGTESGDQGGNFSINNPASSPHRPSQILVGPGFGAPFAHLTIKLVE
jgi:hypothetical protein